MGFEQVHVLRIKCTVFTITGGRHQEEQQERQSNHAMLEQNCTDQYKVTFLIEAEA